MGNTSKEVGITPERSDIKIKKIRTFDEIQAEISQRQAYGNLSFEDLNKLTEEKFLSFIPRFDEPIPRLIELLQHSDSTIRSGAALSLGDEKAKEAVLDLIRVMKNDLNADVRKYSAKALGKIGSRKALSPLKKVSKNDEDKDVRELAAEAITRMKSKYYEK